MKIKLKGKSEFEAFTVIARLLLSPSGGGAGVEDWCRLRSAEKLLMKLIRIASEHGQYKKRITVTLDEMQTALLYIRLQEIPFAPYERILANRLIADIEQRCSNETALRMAGAGA
jgi:hypothetical protein